MNKRERSHSMSAAAELIVLKKCARLVDAVNKRHAEPAELARMSPDVELLAPELELLTREVEEEALEEAYRALTPKKQLKSELLCRLSAEWWPYAVVLERVTFSRLWSFQSPALHMSTKFTKVPDREEPGFCYGHDTDGHCGWSTQSIDPDKYRDEWHKFDCALDIVRQRGKSLQDVLGELVRYLLRMKKVNVYSSNEAILSLFD